VLRRAYRLLLRLFGMMPRRVRLALVHTAMPAFTVGAVCIVERGGEELLLVRTSYRSGWGFPGGLLNRGEEPAAGALRELQEETGLPAELVGEPAVVVDVDSRRVDVVFRARPVGDPGAVDRGTGSPEIVEVAWARGDALPALHDEARDTLLALLRATRPPELPPLLDGLRTLPATSRPPAASPPRHRGGGDA
jgi:8-oxo-dGTP diphosphatase